MLRSDRNIRPEETRTRLGEFSHKGGTRGLIIRTANIITSDILSCMFYHILSYLKSFTLIKQISLQVYVIALVTIFFQQSTKLQLHS
jgi:hypothetical protein